MIDCKSTIYHIIFFGERNGRDKTTIRNNKRAYKKGI